MLTKRREEILKFILEFKTQYGQIPTIREICTHLGLKSTNGVYGHLKALEKEGYLELTPNKARNIKIKKYQNYTLPILGEVPAGTPIYPTITEGETIQLPLKIKGNYILEVTGDSMINAGIKSGDMVVVDTEKSIKNKDIVVALIDGEVTLKRLIFNKDKIELHPENENYDVIKIDKEDLKIIGKASLLLRKL